METSIELLLNQLEKTNENVRRCQNSLTVLVAICIAAIVVILFVIFKGKGKFTKDEIIIGDAKDKEELHKEVKELKKSEREFRKIIEELKQNKEK